MSTIPINTFDIIFNIRASQSSTGTCFSLIHDSRKFLITAKHVLGNYNENPTIEIETNSGWISVDYSQIIVCENNEIDIAAIELQQPVNQEIKFVNFNYSTENIILGGDCYFLGYPYGLKNYNMGNQRGNAIIKKSIISGDVYDTRGSSIGLLLDGHNNPGFSGGPCLTKTSSGWNIFGVISSYVTQSEILYDKDGRQRMIIQENSGIINSHDIDNIVNCLS